MGLGIELISGWRKEAGWPAGGLGVRGTSSSTVCIAALARRIVNVEIRRERSVQIEAKRMVGEAIRALRFFRHIRGLAHEHK
jgi:hypothetical protein